MDMMGAGMLVESIVKQGGLLPPAAMVAGFATSLMPCCLANASVTVALASGVPDPSPRRAFSLSICYGLGSACALTAIGIAAAVVGSAISLPMSVSHALFAIALIVLALDMLQAIHVLPDIHAGEGLLYTGCRGMLAAGIVSGLVASPCCVPVLVAIAGIASMSGNVALGAISMLLYALAHNVVAVAAGTSFGFAQGLLHSRGYRMMERGVRIVLAVAMIALAIKILI